MVVIDREIFMRCNSLIAN